MLEFLMFLAPWGQGLRESRGLLQQVLLWRTWSLLPSGGNLLRPDPALWRAWALFSPGAGNQMEKTHVGCVTFTSRKQLRPEPRFRGVKSLVRCSFLSK